MHGQGEAGAEPSGEFRALPAVHGDDEASRQAGAAETQDRDVGVRVAPGDLVDAVDAVEEQRPPDLYTRRRTGPPAGPNSSMLPMTGGRRPRRNPRAWRPGIAVSRIR
ncbi:hypothetical protein GCM10018785_46840 [Streptomyces longispororuber]|uniref:Uncharacterized protein n=1 Tax=Streptomyces longispororuber TaxID=68230 RepID=A0A919DR18_9ACTN|nr:hypothetical protein GCM10018785_46840 [Streptomyces longispororuber]